MKEDSKKRIIFIKKMAQDSTPAPTPSRANYGFVLYLGSRCALGVFLVWALAPQGGPWSAYLPQPYWAVALPVHALTALALFAFFFYPALNLCLTPPPDDPRVLRDSASLPPQPPPPPHGVPRVFDLDMSHVSRRLYLHE